MRHNKSKLAAVNLVTDLPDAADDPGETEQLCKKKKEEAKPGVPLRPVVKPVIELHRTAVAVKKNNANVPRQTVLLRADRDFQGAGTFSCSSDCVRFYHQGTALELNRKTFDVVGGGVTLEVEGLKHSTLDGVTLNWRLEPGAEPIGGPVTERMTAVDAMLDLHKVSGVALSTSEKNGDGRTVHKQNPGKSCTRAKLTVQCLPADWIGTLVLRAISANVLLFNTEMDGLAVDPMPTKIAVGTGSGTRTYWVEGNNASRSKADTGYELCIQELSEDDPADLVKMTVIEAELHIHEYKKSPVEGGKVDKAAKTDPGADLYRFSRRMLTVAQVVPKDCPCTLIVKAVGGVKLYDADRDGVAIAAPWTIENVDIPDEGKKLWAEGETISGAAKDAGFTLDVEDVDAKCDAVAITVKEIKLVAKMPAYTVVLDAIGAVPGTHPIMTFDVEGPPDWYIDVQLSRVNGAALDAGPGLAASWTSGDSRDDRPTKDHFSSFTAGDRTKLDGSGKATFKVPLDWWQDQARRRPADFQVISLSCRVVAVPDVAASSIGFSAKNGAASATVTMNNNLIGLVFQDNGYAFASGTAKHNIAWHFEVREAGTTEMYTVVQWKFGHVKYWPGGGYGSVKDYGIRHRTHMPEWSIDRLETEPRYHNGIYKITNAGRRAGSSDAPTVKVDPPRTRGYRSYNFETRVHLNFEVPAAVTITRQEGSPPIYDVVIGKLADPQPFELAMHPWHTRILVDGVTMTHPDTYP